MLVEVILNVVIWHHSLSDFIISDHGSLFTFKFWSSLCYFLSIKRKLSNAFYSQTDGQIERQNSTIEAYFKAFVNYKKDNWARFLPMAEFAYNDAKHTSMGYMPFELNCGYHPRVSYKEDVDSHFRYKTADELTKELRNLMATCRENL